MHEFIMGEMAGARVTCECAEESARAATQQSINRQRMPKEKGRSEIKVAGSTKIKEAANAAV
jgi:hypothetical protein